MPGVLRRMNKLNAVSTPEIRLIDLYLANVQSRR